MSGHWCSWLLWLLYALSTWPHVLQHQNKPDRPGQEARETYVTLPKQYSMANLDYGLLLRFLELLFYFFLS